MRAAAVVLLLLLGLAGCSQHPAAAPAALGLAGSGWVLDCTLGAHAAAPWPQSCEAQATTTEGTKAEPWIAVNPTDPLNVVVASKDMNPASSKSCVWNGLGVTHDGGTSWHDVTIGGPFSDRGPTSPFYGYACNTDAMFQFSANGDLHFGVEMYDLEGVLPIPRIHDPAGAFDTAGAFAWGWKILLATSHDGGDTWPDVITFQEGQPSETDYSRMIVSPKSGAILEAINNISSGVTCHVLSSRDGGKTAGLPVKVTPIDNPLDAICRGIVVSPTTGAVVIVFRDGLKSQASGSEGPVTFMRSSDDGLTFTDGNVGFPFHLIPDPFPNMQAPSRAGQQIEIKYDLGDGPGRGTLWCITGEAMDGRDANVYVRSSKDDGRTWSAPVQVNPANESREQWMPQLAIAADGSLHAFYFDRAYGDGHTVDVVHALSTDGGATWSTERVTSKSWDPDLGRHQDGYPWIGDYIGAASVGKDVWAAVPDTSLGGPPQLAAIHISHA